MEDYAETIAFPVSAHVGPPQLTERFDDAIQVNIMKSETSDVMAAGSTLEAAGPTKLIGMQTALEHGRFQFVSIMQSTCDQTAKEETSLSRASSWQNLITYLSHVLRHPYEHLYCGVWNIGHQILTGTFNRNIEISGSIQCLK